MLPQKTLDVPDTTAWKKHLWVGFNLYYFLKEAGKDTLTWQVDLSDAVRYFFKTTKQIGDEMKQVVPGFNKHAIYREYSALYCSMVVNRGHVLSIQETELTRPGGLYLSFLAPGKLRQEDNVDFRESLDYTVSSRPAWSTEWYPLLKNKNNKTTATATPKASKNQGIKV